MDRWTVVQLSDFGRPLLLAGEAEQLQEAGVRLYHGEAATKFDEGTLTLTSHRLLWVVS